MTNEQSIKTLAQSVVVLGEASQRSEAQMAVLLCAVGALLRTHQEPSAFASEFRRNWLQLGAPNQALPDGDPAQVGTSEMLEILEELCPVPLGVRPPDVALPPRI